MCLIFNHFLWSFVSSEPHLIHTTLAHYESAYERVQGEFEPSASLSSFLKLIQKRWGEDFFTGNWLELGCGLGTTFESLESKSGQVPNIVTGVDFSVQACKRAQQRDNCALLFPVQFEVAQLQGDWPSSWPLFDGILDAHLLHCLCGKSEIAKVLRSSFNQLSPGGKILGEVMITSKSFIPDSGLAYDESTGILRKDAGPVLHTLLPAFDWEQLILSSGLQIFYFEVYSHLRFIHNPKRTRMLETDPELLRFIACKPME